MVPVVPSYETVRELPIVRHFDSPTVHTFSGDLDAVLDLPIRTRRFFDHPVYALTRKALETILEIELPRE